MLHIITQYKQLFCSFVMNTEAGRNEGMSANASAIETSSILDKEELKIQNDIIANFDSNLDTKNGNKVELLQKALNKLGIKGKNQKELVVDKIWGKNTSFALDAANFLADNNGAEKNSVLQNTQVKTQELSLELPVEKPVTTVKLKSIKTKEHFGEIEGTFGQKMSGAVLKAAVNVDSINDILIQPGKDLNLLYEKLVKTADEFNLDNGVYSFTPLNISEVQDIVEDYGYKADGFFGGEEMMAVFQIIEDVVLTQRKISKIDDYKENIAILLDYNIDGVLDEKVHFYTQEIELFEGIKNETEFSNLLTNLGYTGIKDFNEKFGKNYFEAREEFKVRLASVLDNRLNINPAELLESETAVKEQGELYNKVNEEFLKNPKFKEIQLKDKDLADKIKYEGAALIFGVARGGAVSFDIAEATNKIIDSIQVGVINGVFGFGINKRIVDLNDGTFTLDLGAVNFIPYIATTAKLYESKVGEFEDLFPKKMDTGVKATFGAGVSVIGAGVGLDLSKIDEKTQLGMEQMINQMEITLDLVLQSIKDKTLFEYTGLINTEENKKSYERVLGLYKSFGDAGLIFLKEGALNNYKRELYERAQGGHLTGISFGASVGFNDGFSKILGIIGVHGEYHSTEWKQTQQSVVEKTVSSGYIKGIETKDEGLSSAVKNLDNTITFRTRTNEFSEVIMDPTLSLEDRWTGFTKFANRKGEFSKELQVTINSFKEVITKAEKDGIGTEEKWFILSTVVQLMKKSDQTNEGKIGEKGDKNSYNGDIDSLLDMKKKRKTGYNELFGFNIDKESQEFDTKLRAAGQAGTIGEVNITGLSFDASASKQVGKDRKTLNGVDVFFSNIQVLSDGDKPILVPITDAKHIEAFKNTIKGLINLSEQVKNELIKGIDNGDIVLNYYSDPDGLDDRILPIIKLKSGRKISVYKPVEDTDKYGVLYSVEYEKKEKEPEVTEKPEVPEAPEVPEVPEKPKPPKPKPVIADSLPVDDAPIVITEPIGIGHDAPNL